MRITLAIAHFDQPNSAATSTQTVAVGLLRQGHDVRIASPDLGPMTDATRELGVPVVEPGGEPPDVLLAQDAMAAFGSD